MFRMILVSALLAARLHSEAIGEDPIVDITIQTRSSSGPRPIPDWDFSPVDLNKGVGGKYIYFGWKRGDEEDAVTHLGFGAYNDHQQDNPQPDYEWNRSDLNRGAGGAYIYTFWKHGGPDYSPIYNVTFIVTSHSSPPPIPGYRAIRLDLNKGAGGPYIWPYASFSNPDDDAVAAAAAEEAIAVAHTLADGDTPGKAVLSRGESGEVLGKVEAEDVVARPR